MSDNISKDEMQDVTGGAEQTHQYAVFCSACDREYPGTRTDDLNTARAKARDLNDKGVFCKCLTHMWKVCEVSAE